MPVFGVFMNWYVDVSGATPEIGWNKLLNCAEDISGVESCWTMGAAWRVGPARLSTRPAPRARA